MLAAVIAIVVYRFQEGRIDWRRALGFHLWPHPSSILDIQLLIARRVLTVLGIVPMVGGAWWLAVRVSTILDRSFGVPEMPTISTGVLTVIYTLVLFVVWDLSRFLLHLALHRFNFLWQFHQVHHSAQILTPLTFHRIHPVESTLYGIRGALSTGLMAGVAFWLFRGQASEYTIAGVHGIGFTLNALTGNLRHSHVWLRFPTRVERWLLSPAQHQIHHAKAAQYHDANFGTWLACWDNMLGCLHTAPKEPVVDIGISEPNHNPNGLMSALFSPIHSAISPLLPTRWAAGFLYFSLFTQTSIAHAQSTAGPSVDDDGSAEKDSDEQAYDGTMIITADRGTPRVAGSAHVITEADLERHEYTDIHQILSQVPGVYLRGEDGFGLRPNIGLRGGNSDRSAKITLMEDGVLIAPAPYAAPAAYYFPMSMRMVGVEVIKGSAAIRHGPQTIGGAINLQTRRLPTDGIIGELDVGYGSNQTIKAHGYSGYGADQWGVLGEVAHLSSNGFKEIDGGGETGFNRQDVMLKAKYTTEPTETIYNELEVKLGYGRELSDETYLGLTVPDFKKNPNRRYAVSNGDNMRWDHQQASLNWRLLVGQDFDLRTVFYHNSLDRLWFKVNGLSNGISIHELLYVNPDSGAGEATLDMIRGDVNSAEINTWMLKGTNDRQFKNYGVQTVGHWRLSTGSIDNELEFGVRWHKDNVIRLHTERAWQITDGEMSRTSEKRQTLLDTHTDASALAFHLHDHLSIGPVSFLPGLRHERITSRVGPTDEGPKDPQTHSVWLPGLGFYVNALDWLTVLGGANKGFSPVSPGSPKDTAPETAWNYETGFRLAHLDTTAEIIAFYSNYDNVVGDCTLSSGCNDDQLGAQFNGGSAIVRGLETSAQQTIPLFREIDLVLSAAYSITEARFSSDFESKFKQFGSVESGFDLPYVPKHQGSGSITFDHERFMVTTRASGRSSMRDIAGVDPEPKANRIAGIMTIDIAAEYRFNPHWSVYGTGTNVSGKQTVESWRPFGARPSAPQKWMLGLKAKL